MHLICHVPHMFICGCYMSVRADVSRLDTFTGHYSVKIFIDHVISQPCDQIV